MWDARNHQQHLSSTWGRGRVAGLPSGGIFQEKTLLPPCSRHLREPGCGWVAESCPWGRSPPWDPSLGTRTATGHLAQVHTF